MNERLVDALQAAALDLPDHALDAIALALDEFAGWTSRATRAMSDVSPAANVQARVYAVADAWRQTPDLPGSAVALALRTTRQAITSILSSQRVEIVWTGPSVGAVNARSTAQVFIETVRAARSSLLCLSFAAYKDPTILAELEAAADRGVVVTLILDDSEQSRGALTVDARPAFESLEGKVGFYIWPVELRPTVGHGVARFHAKAIIADHHVAFVTSANLTGAAMTKNIELGLVVHGGPIPRDLEEHVRALIVAQVLRRVG